MAKIDQDLLQAIADKQNIVVRAVYPQIAKVVHDSFLERDLAALVLASRLRININKYSKPDQREQIRGYLTGGGGGRIRDWREGHRVNGIDVQFPNGSRL